MVTKVEISESPHSTETDLTPKVAENLAATAGIVPKPQERTDIYWPEGWLPGRLVEL